jgi:SAM-dependent methyltransferase
MTKLTWPAPERNKGPILEVLERVLPRKGTLLEIASGTGQHAAHFARHLPDLVVQPSDVEPENLASIRAWVKEVELPNLREPLVIDVRADWGIAQVDAVFNANMIHIAPWECALALFEGVGRVLVPDGVFVLYGPFRISGAHTAPSNETFDHGLKSRDQRWGVRDIDDLLPLARSANLVFRERVVMPANNQCLVFARS